MTLMPFIALFKWGASVGFSLTGCLQADPGAAMQHFQAAAGQGDAFATFNLGYMHMKGIGTPANATAAKASFEVAARKGIPAAFNGLGVLYFEGGGGGVVDYAAAQEAFVQGSALGDPDAMFNLATLHAGGILLLLFDSSDIAAHKDVRCTSCIMSLSIFLVPSYPDTQPVHWPLPIPSAPLQSGYLPLYWPP